MSKMTEEEYYEKLYRLTYIIRYGNIPRVKNESVAEHSFLVSAILFQLHEEYDFDLGDAVKISIAHDILEAETNDICHILKHEDPELYVALKKAEKRLIGKYPVAVNNGIYDYDNDITASAHFAHLADAIQCMQYSKNEISLGAVYYFEEVYHNSKKRVEELKKHLYMYRR